MSSSPQIPVFETRRDIRRSRLMSESRERSPNPSPGVKIADYPRELHDYFQEFVDKHGLTMCIEDDPFWFSETVPVRQKRDEPIPNHMSAMHRCGRGPYGTVFARIDPGKIDKELPRRLKQQALMFGPRAELGIEDIDAKWASREDKERPIVWATIPENEHIAALGGQDIQELEKDLAEWALQADHATDKGPDVKKPSGEDDFEGRRKVPGEEGAFLYETPCDSDGDPCPDTPTSSQMASDPD